MQESSKIHVGLDVHKDSISIAAAEPGRVPGRLIGKVTHDVSKLLKVLAKVGNADQLHIVYEAGPTGFGLQRALYRRPAAADRSRLELPLQGAHRQTSADPTTGSVRADTKDGMDSAVAADTALRGVECTWLAGQ